MGNNHLVTAALQVVNRVLVFLKVIRIGTCRELKQKLIRSIKVQAIGPFDAQIHKLGVVDLKAHLELHIARMGTQQPIGLPHVGVVKVWVPAVRRAHHVRYADGASRLEHRQALLEVCRAVIDSGQDMAMDVSHIALLSASLLIS